MYFKIVLFTCALLQINIVRCADSFVFAETPEADRSKQNVMGKKPLDMGHQCNIGEFLYPGDQNDDYVCDCKPGHIYYPASDRCFAAYTRGPCAARQQLVLPYGSILPVCIPSMCRNENEVLFQGGCVRLNTAGPCHLPELGNVVGINPSTMQLDCVGNDNVVEIKPVNAALEDRFGDPEVQCIIGGRRWHKAEGKCKNKV